MMEQSKLGVSYGFANSWFDLCSIYPTPYPIPSFPIFSYKNRSFPDIALSPLLGYAMILIGGTHLL